MHLVETAEALPSHHSRGETVTTIHTVPSDARRKPDSEAVTRKPVVSMYWTIEKAASLGLELLVIDRDGEEALAVFDREEAAVGYLRSSGLSGRWRVRASGAGELISALYGPHAGVPGVALDPLPEPAATDIQKPVSVGRKSFIDGIVSHPRLLEPVVQ